MVKTFIRDHKGATFLNQNLRHIKGGFIAPDSTQNPITTAAAVSAISPTQSAPIIIEGPSDAFSEVFSTIGLQRAADNIDVQNRLECLITDTAYRRRLMNRPILVDHVYGTNLQPFKLCESIFLEPQQTLQVALFNNSIAGTSTFQQALEVRKFQEPCWNEPSSKKRLAELRQRKPRLYPFWQTTDNAISLTPGQEITTFLTVSSDIRFVAFAAMARAISVGGGIGETTELFTMNMFDGQTERPLQNQPVARTCCSGTNTFPYWFPTGWMLEPNSKVKLNFKSLLTTGTSVDIFYTLFGTACYVG